MKKIFILLVFSIQILNGQNYEPFLDQYYFNKNNSISKANSFESISGSPYKNDKFITGILKMKDSTVYKLPLRYNIYADEMEYQMDNKNYYVTNKQNIEEVSFENSIYKYMTIEGKRGFFEQLVLGKCTLLKKYIIHFQAAEGPKPIEGTPRPAQFLNQRSQYFILTNNKEPVMIKKMKAILEVLNDQKNSLEVFIKTNNVKKLNEKNLIKIVNYYNSL